MDNMNIQRLRNQRVYLAGAMDRVPDRGSTWRDNITPFLENLGLTVFNPIKKPCLEGNEDHETHSYKTKLKSSGQYDELAMIMKGIRAVDLRLVDISDFLIVNIDVDVHACGTYEEISLANRSKKPILIHIEQGKSHAPDWLFGTIPHQMIFSNWDELKRYLNQVNSSVFMETYKRWQFFSV
jgi:hypothetical protein